MEVRFYLIISSIWSFGLWLIPLQLLFTSRWYQRPQWDMEIMPQKHGEENYLESFSFSTPLSFLLVFWTHSLLLFWFMKYLAVTMGALGAKVNNLRRRVLKFFRVMVDSKINSKDEINEVKKEGEVGDGIEVKSKKDEGKWWPYWSLNT